MGELDYGERSDLQTALNAFCCTGPPFDSTTRPTLSAR